MSGAAQALDVREEVKEVLHDAGITPEQERLERLTTELEGIVKQKVEITAFQLFDVFWSISNVGDFVESRDRVAGIIERLTTNKRIKKSMSPSEFSELIDLIEINRTELKLLEKYVETRENQMKLTRQSEAALRRSGKLSWAFQIVVLTFSTLFVIGAVYFLFGEFSSQSLGVITLASVLVTIAAVWAIFEKWIDAGPSGYEAGGDIQQKSKELALEILQRRI